MKESRLDLEAIRSEFVSKSQIYQQLNDEALFIMNLALKNIQIKLHSITHRVKTADSFLGKTQRKQFEKPFDEIKDVVGIRVICLFLSDIDRVGAMIRDSFKVLEEDNKVGGSDISSFGYMSLHFVVTMKPEYLGPRYDSIATIPFEIQVRTIAMDAWANVSHYLDYKSPSDVPSDLKRDFYALSGLFYVADRHFEMFFRASEKSREKMLRIFDKAPSFVQLDQEINLDSLTAYLRKKFPEREPATSDTISNSVELLTLAGYKSIGEIENAIRKGWNAFLFFEEQLAKKYNMIEDDGNYYELYNNNGVIHVLMSLLDDKFRDMSNFAYPQLVTDSRKLIKE